MVNKVADGDRSIVSLLSMSAKRVGTFERRYHYFTSGIYFFFPATLVVTVTCT